MPKGLRGGLARVGGVMGLTLLAAAAARLWDWRADSEEGRRRGRHADTPLGMTWLGWKDVLRRTWDETNDDRLLSLSAGVAFYFLLALAPGLSVLVSIYGLFADARTIGDQLLPLLSVLPHEGVQLIGDQLVRLAGKPVDSLSFNLFVSLVIALWSANAGIKAMFDALNVIYDEREARSFLWFNVVSLVTTLTGLLLLALMVFAVTFLPALLALIPGQSLLAPLLSILRWPVLVLVATLAFAVLYWIGPSRRAARFSWLLPGAFMAALVWVGASSLFGWYVSTLGDYAATYGSLAAIVVFMTWLWLSATIILVGGELNAELEHQTARDTTMGPPKPRGTRGAVMADQIGRAVVDR